MVLAAIDESAGGEIEDQAAVEFGIEGEVEVVESLVRIPEGGEFASAIQEPVRAPGEFVGVECGQQVDWRHGFGLRLAEASFQHSGHAAEPELPQAAL